MGLHDVIERLANAMRNRLDRTWQAALKVAIQEGVVDPIALQQLIARWGMKGCEWQYDEALAPSVEAEVLDMDDMTCINDFVSGDWAETSPGIVSLGELLDLLEELARRRPDTLKWPVMAGKGNMLLGITSVWYGPTREAPVSPEDLVVKMVLE